MAATMSTSTMGLDWAWTTGTGVAGIGVGGMGVEVGGTGVGVSVGVAVAVGGGLLSTVMVGAGLLSAPPQANAAAEKEMKTAAAISFRPLFLDCTMLSQPAQLKLPRPKAGH